MAERKEYKIGATVYVVPGKKGLPVFNPDSRDRYITGEPQKAKVTHWLKAQLDAGCLVEVEKPESNPQVVTHGASINSDPPAEDPPAEDPPAEDPPAEDPPAEDPPKKSGGKKSGKKK